MNRFFTKIRGFRINEEDAEYIYNKWRNELLLEEARNVLEKMIEGYSEAEQTMYFGKSYSRFDEEPRFFPRCVERFKQLENENTPTWETWERVLRETIRDFFA